MMMKKTRKYLAPQSQQVYRCDCGDTKGAARRSPTQTASGKQKDTFCGTPVSVPFCEKLLHHAKFH